MSLANLVWFPRRLVRVAQVVVAALLVLIISSTHVARLLAADIHPLQPSAFTPLKHEWHSIQRAQQAPNCVEIVVNGGFEQTSVGWTSVAGASLFTYATDQYVGGQHSLLLGFTAPLNIPVIYGVEQLLVLPAESSGIEFAFHYAIQVEGEAGPGDQAYLTFTDVATNQLLAMLVLSPTDGVWSMGRYDLTPLAGKSVRLAFAAEADGEPGKLTMRVDDVSVLTCLPAEAFALDPLPTPTPTALPPEPLLLMPEPLPTTSPVAPSPSPPTSTRVAPIAPQTSNVFPQAGSIDALAECSCASSLYACTDFSSWAIAQACYTQCQVSAGYDIHNLDQDRNGVACELELQDVAPLDATPSPQPTPSTMTQTNVIDPNAPLAVVDAVTETLPPSTTTEQPPVASTVAGSPGQSTTIAVSGVTTVTTETVAMAEVSATVSSTVPSTAAIAPAAANIDNPASSLSSIEMLTLLLFSPLGYLALGALVVVGALSLWVAFMLGQRGVSQRKPPANKSAPEDYALQPSNEAPVPKV